MTEWFAELSESTAKLGTSFPKPIAFLGGLCAHVGPTSQKDPEQVPCKSVISVSCGHKVPFVSDYPAHVMLPALRFVSPAEGPSERHGQPLPNAA